MGPTRAYVDTRSKVRNLAALRFARRQARRFGCSYQFGPDWGLAQYRKLGGVMMPDLVNIILWDLADYASVTVDIQNPRDPEDIRHMRFEFPTPPGAEYVSSR